MKLKTIMYHKLAAENLNVSELTVAFKNCSIRLARLWLARDSLKMRLASLGAVFFVGFLRYETCLTYIPDIVDRDGSD